MYELSGEANLHPNKKPRVLGHTKNQELVSWEGQVPRDNQIYYLSETQNLKHEDYERREQFRKTIQSKRTNLLHRMKSFGLRQSPPRQRTDSSLINEAPKGFRKTGSIFSASGTKPPRVRSKVAMFTNHK